MMRVKQECLEEAEHDEFDDLTLEELKSLLDNFKNLAKPEQMDLIQYMRKLEKTNPEKVKLLKAAGPNMSGQGQQGPGDRYSHKNFQFSLHFCICLSADYEIFDVLYIFTWSIFRKHLFYRFRVFLLSFTWDTVLDQSVWV